MSEAASIRTAVPGTDAAAVSAIYAAAVLGSVATFEELPPDADEMAARMRATLERLPWLVAEVDGSVAGYAYASPITYAEAARTTRWTVPMDGP